MIEPTTTPGTSTPDAATPDAGPAGAAPPTARGRCGVPDWRSAESRAREMLEKLGRGDHPDADVDPVHALYQVAVDFRCSAHGYRELYLHTIRHTPVRSTAP